MIMDLLNENQKEVARYTIEGYNPTEIGRLIFRSPGAVKACLGKIFKITGLKNRQQFIVQYYKEQLSPSSDPIIILPHKNKITFEY